MLPLICPICALASCLTQTRGLCQALHSNTTFFLSGQGFTCWVVLHGSVRGFAGSAASWGARSCPGASGQLLGLQPVAPHGVTQCWVGLAASGGSVDMAMGGCTSPEGIPRARTSCWV